MGVSLSALIISAFWGIWCAVKSHKYTHYMMKGGRASTKSSFISLCIVLLIVKYPWANAVIVRRYTNTLKDSVMEQINWAIDALGLTEYFDCPKSKLEITYRPTGQRIVFRGMDDPTKLKSTKFRKGYPAIIWFEELDQYRGWADVSSALQSLMRGGDIFWCFYSYNPPRSIRSWANERAAKMEQRPDAIVSHSTYLDVVGEHPEWVGSAFIEEAEFVKVDDELQYRHEYLGEPVGNGTEVFDRVEFRTITDKEIETFDNLKCGQDFGWYPDPWAVTLSEWQPAKRTLLTFKETGGNKLHAGEQAKRLEKFLNVQGRFQNIPVWSDDADPDIIAAQYGAGINARPAGKGGMRDASYRLLQSVTWVIDPVRCPHLAKEVREMQYEVNRDGEVLNVIPDGNDHWVDATRYAMMRDVKRPRNNYRVTGE